MSKHTPEQCSAARSFEYKRMYFAACEALGAISEELELDPAEGGAEPIIYAIQEIKQQRDELAALLRECLGDYGHSRFTDRRRMAPRIEAALSNVKP